jgi:hypothetical protein
VVVLLWDKVAAQHDENEAARAELAMTPRQHEQTGITHTCQRIAGEDINTNSYLKHRRSARVIELEKPDIIKQGQELQH